VIADSLADDGKRSVPQWPNNSALTTAVEKEAAKEV